MGEGTTPFFTRQLQLDADPSRDDRFTVDIDDRWCCPIVPHGGLVTAIAARAMQQALDRPELALRSISVVFAEQVPAGPVEVDVRLIRSGRSMAQLTATVRGVGRGAGHTSVAVFGADRPGFEFTDLPVPAFAPPPEDCPSFREPPPEMPERPFEFRFWEQVEGRPVDGHPPWEDWIPDTSEVTRWYRIDERPEVSPGVLDPLALVMLADTMPSALSERMGPAAQQHRWLPPSTDLTVHLFGPCTSEWVFVRNHARHAGDGYASLDLELWCADSRTLVAYGTQMMVLQFLDEPPAAPVRPTGA